MNVNNKNWNDRADKDLFFTILSVKNIGVISGAEWTTIGNHMRGLGYGFTNEGCRQHFQGLRRAQNKIEGNGSPAEAARRNDPTMNPITRRPGPGRGRPRKQPSTTTEGAPPVAASPPMTGNLLHMVPGSIPGPNHNGPPGGTMSEAMPPTFPSPPSHTPDLPLQPPHLHPLQRAPEPKDTQQQPVQLQPNQQAPPTPGQTAVAVDQTPPKPELEAPQQESLGPEPESVEDDDDDDLDEPNAKRQRMATPDTTKEALDDEAVLALAAHNGNPDPFPNDFTYGEA
ncbi:Fc.00g014940.m01.CDS01 [Cosmosporella sp. VM-42]